MYEPDLDPDRYDVTTDGDCDPDDGCNVGATMEKDNRGNYVEYEAFKKLLDVYNVLKDFYDTVKKELP